ncbi:hypothetical protein [Nocardioides sp.]|uniref:hypothetical protein n=1 Tax=Nocardioides sp. TaxID=35761 RepID=UPI0035156504
MRPLVSALLLSLALALVPGSSGTAPAQAAPAGLVVSTNSWGKLRLAMTAERAQRTGMVSTTPSGCAAGYEMTPRFANRGFVVWTRSGSTFKVDQIVVRTARDRTAKKVGVGSTLAQLRRAYPGLSAVRSGAAVRGSSPSGDDVWIASYTRRGKGTISFQFAFGVRPKSSSKVDTVIVARKPQVYYGC